MKCLRCNYDGSMIDNKCPKCGFNSNGRSFLENEMKKCTEEAEILFRKKEKQKDEYVKIDSASETSYVLTPKSDIEGKSASNSGTGSGITANQAAWLLAAVVTIFIIIFHSSSTIVIVLFLVGTIIVAVLKSKEKSARDSKLKPASHNPKCPTCGSERIEKISVGTKIVFLGPFFPLYKTFKCSSCGYKW